MFYHEMMDHASIIGHLYLKCRQMQAADTSCSAKAEGSDTVWEHSWLSMSTMLWRRN